MRSTKTVRVISAPAAGDVIIGGVPPSPGDTIWERKRWIAMIRRSGILS